MVTKNDVSTTTQQTPGTEDPASSAPVHDTIQALSAQVQQLGEQVKEVASSYYQQGRQQTHEWEQALTTKIQEKPVQSLLLAGGIGLLLGFLWRRR